MSDQQPVTNSREKKKGGKFSMITPPNTLATRVSGSGPISADVLKKAEAAVTKHTKSFEENAKSTVETMQALLEGLGASGPDNADAIYQIHRKAHDIRGQGGTFGYHLVTNIGDSLFKYTESLKTCDKNSLAVLNAHVDAIRAVLVNKVIGDNDPVGREIAAGLDAAVRKYSA